MPSADGAALVSILIPTYNRAEQLRAALDSALAQTYRPIEILVSDNASSDATESVGRSYAAQHPEIEYNRQPENVGAPENFEWLRNAAHGDFLMFLGDDDWLDPGYVTACLDVFTRSPASSLVAGRALYHPKAGTPHFDPPVELTDPSPSRRVIDYYRHVNLNGIFYGVAKRACDERVQPFGQKLADDWTHVAALAFLGEVHTVEAVDLHRSIADGYTLQYIVRGLGVRGFQSKFPSLAIASHVFGDIARGSNVYAGTGRVRRYVLATECASILLIRFGSTNGVQLARRVKHRLLPDRAK